MTSDLVAEVDATMKKPSDNCCTDFEGCRTELSAIEIRALPFISGVLRDGISSQLGRLMKRPVDTLSQLRCLAGNASHNLNYYFACQPFILP